MVQAPVLWRCTSPAPTGLFWALAGPPHKSPDSPSRASAQSMKQRPGSFPNKTEFLHFSGSACLNHTYYINPILTSPQFHVFLKGKLTQQFRIKGDKEMASLAPEQKPPLPQGAQGTEACRSGQGGLPGVSHQGSARNSFDGRSLGGSSSHSNL